MGLVVGLLLAAANSGNSTVVPDTEGVSRVVPFEDPGVVGD